MVAVSEIQRDPTVSDDDSSNQGLPDPGFPPTEPEAVEDPNYLDDFEVVSDSVAERSGRLDRTEFGEEATPDPSPALIDASDSDGELLGDPGDVDDSPEASAVHIDDE